jgi:hypothetical protein
MSVSPHSTAFTGGSELESEQSRLRTLYVDNERKRRARRIVTFSCRGSSVVVHGHTNCNLCNPQESSSLTFNRWKWQPSLFQRDFAVLLSALCLLATEKTMVNDLHKWRRRRKASEARPRWCCNSDPARAGGVTTNQVASVRTQKRIGYRMMEREFSAWCCYYL